MPLSQRFVKDRALHTSAAQKNMAAHWVWEGKTLAQWEADLDAFQEKEEAVSRAQAQLSGFRGELIVALDGLHELTVVYLTLLKTLHRKNAAYSELLFPLTSAGGGRNAVLDEAAALQSAWQEIDPAWEPRPGKTLAGFAALIEGCGPLKKSFGEAETAWRNRAAELRRLAEELHGDCVAWYAAATIIFGEDTAEGAMIRGCIPTTYRKAKVEKGTR